MVKRIENKINKLSKREENKNYSSPVNSHKNNTFALNIVNYNHHRKGGENRKSKTITIPGQQRGLRARTKPQISDIPQKKEGTGWSTTLLLALMTRKLMFCRE